MTPKPHMTLENGDKLYEGEYGITRNGDRVGPVMPNDCGYYPWFASGEEYSSKGEYCFGATDGEDIIARADPAISLDTLENLTTPLGLLDDATRKALEDHGGPYEYFDCVMYWRDASSLYPVSLTYRVKRQPKVETVKHWLNFVGHVAIDKINGEYDLTTVRPWVEGEE